MSYVCDYLLGLQCSSHVYESYFVFYVPEFSLWILKLERIIIAEVKTLDLTKVTDSHLISISYQKVNLVPLSYIAPK